MHVSSKANEKLAKDIREKKKMGRSKDFLKMSVTLRFCSLKHILFAWPCFAFAYKTAPIEPGPVFITMDKLLNNILSHQ